MNLNFLSNNDIQFIYQKSVRECWQKIQEAKPASNLESKCINRFFLSDL